MSTQEMIRLKASAATTLAALLLAAATWTGCGPGPVDSVGEVDGMLRINYRGQVRIAERRGGLVLIEGDIEVAPQELHVIEETEDGVGSRAQAVRIQGDDYRWTNGVVPYELDGSLNAAQQTSIEDAMDDWEEEVPGLRFVERTTGNASSHPDYVQFELDTVCSSSVGRVTGMQRIRLTNNCITSFSVHHEIGHALGLYHQHSRKDRDFFVTINRGEIRGCPNTATQQSDCGTCAASDAADCGCTAAQVNDGTCDTSHNFTWDTSRANLGSYDYDSMMHYRADAFSKSGIDTITVLQDDPATSAPYVIGQRTHFSEGDVAGMRAMYPVIRTHRVVFHNTGFQRICYLQGRDQDVASRHQLYVPSPVGPLPAFTFDGGLIESGMYAEGDHLFHSCVVDSVFWAKSYDYPNTTKTYPSSHYSATDEAYTHNSFTLRVLNRGLIAVVSNIL